LIYLANSARNSTPDQGLLTAEQSNMFATVGIPVFLLSDCRSGADVTKTQFANLTWAIAGNVSGRHEAIPLQP